MVGTTGRRISGSAVSILVDNAAAGWSGHPATFSESFFGLVLAYTYSRLVVKA